MSPNGSPGAAAAEVRLPAAVPYPWPWDGILDPRRTALVVAGAQQAWVGCSQRAAEVSATIEALGAELSARGATVVRLRHNAATARQGRVGLPPVSYSEGWTLAPAGALPGALVVDCFGIDGFHASALDEVLRARGIDRLVVVGYGAEAAVDCTVRAANDMGYECLTLTDAVAPFDESTGAHALSSVTMSGGIFGAIASSADLLEALPPQPSDPSLDLAQEVSTP